MPSHLGVRSVVALIMLAGPSKPVTGEEAGRPAVAVQVFNHARVPAETLTRAQAHVARIYRGTGVEVLWTDAAGTDAPGRFAIKLIIKPKASGSRVMGTAIGDTRGAGGTAFVYRDRVLDVAHERDLVDARVLAYAMAHEMGHLLLPYPAHATTGMMRAEWDSEDFRHIATGWLRFTPVQASAIRAKASGCCGR